MKKTYIIAALLFASLLLVGCKDELGESIFENKITENTEFDEWLVENYEKPYNLRFLYRLDDATTDKKYNLVPVRYDKAQVVAHAVKYLWLDVYKKHVSEQFLKEQCPRILNVLGCPAINAAQQTETLGVAEGGIKITLYNMNEIELDKEHVAWLNKYIFHVMHHEFSHILHQHKSFPKRYEQISAGLYDSQGWQYHTDKEAYSLGFVTPYSMSEAHEDFVEVISSYITDPREVWQARGFKVSADNSSITINSKDEGAKTIETKIDMCKEWLVAKYNINLDAIRGEVQRRQDAIDYDMIMNDSYDK